MEMRGRWNDRWGTIPDYTTGEVAITRKYQPLFLWSVLTFQLAFIHSLGRTSRHTSNCFAHDAPDIYNSPPLPYPSTTTIISHLLLHALYRNYQYQPHQKLNAKTCFHTTAPHLHIRPDLFLHHPGNNKSVSSRSARAWRIGKKQQCHQTTTTTTTRHPLHHTPAQTHCTVPTAQKRKKKRTEKKQSDPKSDSNPLPMAIISSP